MTIIGKSKANIRVFSIVVPFDNVRVQVVQTNNNEYSRRDFFNFYFLVQTNKRYANLSTKQKNIVKKIS